MTAAVAPNDKARAILAAFTAMGGYSQFKPLLDDKKLGEAILQSITLFAKGTSGDFENTRKALILLRSVGLEDTARRAALQLMLLDRQG